MTKLTFTGAKAVSRDLIYVRASPDDHDRGAPFTRLCEYHAGRWSYQDYDFWTSGLTLYKAPGIDHSILCLLSEKGDVVLKAEQPRREIVLDPASDLGLSYKLGRMTDIRQIGQHLYASGEGGQIYRRDADGRWDFLDRSMLDEHVDMHWVFEIFPDKDNIPEGLRDPKISEEFYRRRAILQGRNFFRIDGPSESEMYVCGGHGTILAWDGSAFAHYFTVGDAALVGLFVENDDRIWVCGRDGMLLRGNRRSGFREVPATQGQQHFSSMTIFQGKLYLASIARPRGLFVYDGTRMTQVTSGLKPDIEDVHTVEAVDDVLWAVGSKDILRFDGKTWERIEFPDNGPLRKRHP